MMANVDIPAPVIPDPNREGGTLQRRQAEQKAAFLAAFAVRPLVWHAVQRAATVAGVHRATIYRWRARDAVFAAEWDRIVADEHVALRRKAEAELAAWQAAQRKGTAVAFATGVEEI